jgi:hypothetical protein
MIPVVAVAVVVSWLWQFPSVPFFSLSFPFVPCLFGGCISFQRKGGNGSLSNNIPKTTIQHPGNNIQLKVKINKLIPILEPFKLSQYTI